MSGATRAAGRIKATTSSRDTGEVVGEEVEVGKADLATRAACLEQVQGGSSSSLPAVVLPRLVPLKR
jgi:hypothetical protein